MKKGKKAMKRALPILVFILILLLRQSPETLIVDHIPGSHSSVQKTNFINGPQGLGWTEAMNTGDPKDAPPVFEAFQDEEQEFTSAYALKHFRFPFHYRSNPLLIDRPPPEMGA
jgi:hypothetical protein